MVAPSRTCDTFAAIAMPHTRIAIALTARNVWSETFIAAHLERLREVVLVLSDGRPPRLADGVPLLLPVTPKARLRSWVERKVLRLDQPAQRHRRTVEMLRERRVQVVLAEYGNMGDALADACRDAGVPLVAHFHGYDAHRHNEAQECGGYRRLFDRAAALVVVSRSMEQRLVELGAPQEKVLHNCYGIDVGRFASGAPAEAAPHFLAVGRFVDKKAPQLTLIAFRKVLDLCPGARLTMVGDGMLWEACRQMVVALRMEEQVVLAGVQDHRRIAELLRASRAFVQHSVVTSSGDSEGTPLAVLEAMATGIPVVATRHAGIGDVVEHGVSGLLGPEGDVEAMAANMVRLVQEPWVADAMGRAGRAHVERHYRVEDRIAALQAILDRAAGH